MRVLIVDTYYPAFLRRHYAERPELASAPYEAQFEALMERSFGTSDAYSLGFRALGHEAHDVLVNCEPLQRRWAAENGLRARQGLRRRSLASIAAAQIRAYDPEVVYLQDLSALAPTELERLRSEGRLVVGQIASPAPAAEVSRCFDLITTSFPHFVDRFRAIGVDSEYLPIAFHTKVTERLAAARISAAPDRPREFERTFVGGVDPRIHGRGTTFLETLCEQVEVDVWGYGADALPGTSPIRRRYHGEAWGLDMYAVLANSQIAINRHIDVAEDNSNNMRLYEATGVGALLMTEVSANLDTIFKPGTEVVAYDGVDDLIDKLEHYAANEEERLRIAAAGQARTLADHTYEQVIAQLAPMLESRLPG